MSYHLRICWSMQQTPPFHTIQHRPALYPTSNKKAQSLGQPSAELNEFIDLDTEYKEKKMITYHQTADSKKDQQTNAFHCWFYKRKVGSNVIKKRMLLERVEGSCTGRLIYT